MQDVRLKTLIKRRVRVALVAYACLLAQVSTFAHRVLVQHVTCAEHGETIHVALPGQSGDSSAIGGVRSSSSAWWSPSLAGLPPRASGVAATVADDHEHCSVVLSRAVSAPSPSHQVVGPAASCRGLGTPCGRFRGTPVDTYLIAPKTSPPVRA